MQQFVLICITFWCILFHTTGQEVTVLQGPKNTTVIEGETVTLDCIFSSISPLSYWYRNETGEIISLLNGFISSEIDEDRQVRYKILGGFNSNFSLQMNDVKVTDSGTYSCGIFPDISSISFNHLATATLIVLPNYNGNSSSIPRCTLSNAAHAQNTTEVGDLVYLTCLRKTDEYFEGSLEPELIWYRKSPDDVISEPQRDQSGLSIYLKPEDNGVEFTCKLQYPKLQQIVEGECSVIPLRIPPSSWLEPSGEVQVQENSPVIFRCNGTGIPAVTSYTWRIHPEIPENRYDLKENGRVLLIKDVQKEDISLNVTCTAQIASGIPGDASPAAILKIMKSTRKGVDGTINLEDTSTFNLPTVIIPILTVLVVLILLGIIWKYIQHKRKRNTVPKRSKEADTKLRSSSKVADTPSPLPPRLAHYDYPSTQSSAHSNKTYTGLDSSSIQNEYLDLSGMNNQSNTEGAKCTQDFDADDYETYEIGN